MRAGPLAAVLLVSLWHAGLAHAGPVERSKPVAIQIFSPKALSERVSNQRLIELIRAAIEPGTDLSVVEPGELLLSKGELFRCNESGYLSCWVRASRPFDRDEAGSDDGTFAAYMVAISIRPMSERSVGVALLLIPSSSETYRHVRRRAKVAIDELEDWIFSRSVAIDYELFERDEGSWRAFEALLKDRFSSAIGIMHTGFGSLTINAGSEGGGMLTRLDDQDAGVISADGNLSLRHVRNGAYTLSLHDPDEAWFFDPVEVRVQTASTTTVRAELRPRDISIPTYGGVALMAVGAAVTIYAFAAPASRELELCAAPSSCSRSGGFVSFGEGDGSSSGILIAPLGYSLSLAGLSWALSPLIVSDNSASPWGELGVSLLAGALVYGFSAAAGG